MAHASSNLAIKIRSLMAEKNLTIQGLEKRAGLRTNAIRRIMSGDAKRPNAEFLLAISKVLGCSVGELLDEEISERHQKSTIQDVLFTETKLLEDIFMHIVSFYRSKNLNIPNKVLYESIEKIYIYLIKNNKGKFDIEFADWYLEDRF